MAIGCEYAQKITWHSVTKVSMKYASQFLPNCSGHEHYLWNMKHSSCVLKTIQWFESLKKLFYIHNRLTKVKDNIVFYVRLIRSQMGGECRLLQFSERYWRALTKRRGFTPLQLEVLASTKNDTNLKRSTMNMKDVVKRQTTGVQTGVHRCARDVDQCWLWHQYANSPHWSSHSSCGQLGVIISFVNI